ncbi:495_t:CDS:1, partial [Ambispora leptoticha]
LIICTGKYLTAKTAELVTKQENYKLIQERNTDLQTKLQTVQAEITNSRNESANSN